VPKHHARLAAGDEEAAAMSPIARRTCHAAIVGASLACRRSSEPVMDLQDSDRRDGEPSPVRKAMSGRSTGPFLRNLDDRPSHLPSRRRDHGQSGRSRLAFPRRSFPAPASPGADGVHHPGAYWDPSMALASWPRSSRRRQGRQSRSDPAIRINGLLHRAALGSWDDRAAFYRAVSSACRT